MYVIVELPNKKYECQGRIQDGTEYWTCDTLEEAIKSMKQFAKFMNGATKLKKKDILFLRQQQVTRVEYVEFKP